MPTHTTWSRLEPRTRNPELAGGVAAPVHDPLWLLGRQRQVGEFLAEDAGSPVAARVTGERQSITAYRPGADGEPVAYDAGSEPLEAVVERESIRPADDADDGRDRGAVTAGAHFLRLLAAHGLAESATAFPESVLVADGASSSDDDAASDEGRDARRYLNVVAGRTVDGDAIAAAVADAATDDGGYDATDLPLPESLLPAPDAAQVVPAGVPLADVLDAYRDWYTSLYSEPAAEEPTAAGATDDGPTTDTPAAGASAAAAWDDEHLEYRFAVGGSTADGDDVTLAASAYHGGRLDWYAFDGVDEPLASTLPASDAATAVAVDETTVPTPASFPGMPRPRWWQLEDGSVDVNLFDPSVEDLGRLLLTEFALLGGDDWFSLPLETAVGSITALDGVEVTDTFGESTTISPVESTAPTAEDDWRWFSHATDDGGPSTGLFLPPTLVASLDGPTVEEVGFVRDERANLAWGVERVVEAADGAPLDRTTAERLPADGDPEVPQTPPQAAAGAARYRLSTDVPAYWFPFVPERVLTPGFDPAAPTTGAAMRLRAARLLADADDAVSGPRGRILAGDDRVIAEAELPPAGTTVSRAYQLARGADGSMHLWSGRRRATGDRERSSGLAFDTVDE